MIDFEKKLIHLGLNGEFSITLESKNLNNNTPKLVTGQILLGVSVQEKGEWEQFVGSVANIKFGKLVDSDVTISEVDA